MEIIIHSAILHLLDTHGEQPVLSDFLLELQPETLQYLSSHIQKAFLNEDTKDCTLLDSSDFFQILPLIQQDFILASKQIAEKWFSLMKQWPSIPSADLVIVLAEIHQVPCITALKLNYKTTWIHQSQIQQGITNQLISHSIALPALNGKADEGFFVALDGSLCRILEKRYDIDQKKSAYLGRYLLQAQNGYSPKEKLQKVQQAIEQVNQQFYQNIGIDPPVAAATILDSFCQSESTTTPTTTDISQALYEDLPHAKQAFIKVLEENQLSPTEPIPLLPTAIKRMEKQRLKTISGIEIKVPVEVYQDTSAIEFISNPDGTTSLLVKNVVLK